MRIISGKARGIKLTTIEGISTRPTTDRIKENIFNIIAFEIGESDVLDLFSGSGAIGLEFASRGAKKVSMVENNPKCIKFIKANINATSLNDLVEIYTENVFNSFRFFSSNSFDIIFMDPPYSKNLVNETIELIAEKKILKKDGIIIAEHDIKDEVFEKICDIEKYKYKKYGKTGVSFYRRK
ncbi:16S rRNA (guanine(966)-N(2))-methyltransferase RsmD [Helicovermis profundi]